MLNYSIERNLENSLQTFLETQLSSDAINCIARIGRKEDNDWTLPCITLYVESLTAPRLEIGSNKRDERHLIILDVYATTDGERLDLKRWLEDKINDGFRYYSFSVNPLNPDSPTKVAGGLVSVDFVTNTRVSLGQNIEEADKYRHRISINVWISGN